MTRMIPLAPLKLACILVLALAGFGESARAFDGERALDLIRAQCNLGPRVPESEGHAKWQVWIKQELKSLGYAVTEQHFQTKLAITGETVEAVNFWAVAQEAADGPTSPALVLSAHWDTRPFADNDPQGGGRLPMLGANDGGSGVAVALELARSLQKSPLRTQVALAFWDAEDGGLNSNPETWAMGARYAAKNPPAWIDRMALGINLDMVGGSDLQLTRESASLMNSPRAVEDIWRIGHDLAPRYFTNYDPQEIIDDHLPWIEAGHHFIDIIGLPYAHWHKTGDSPENCSAQSLQAVGDVVLQYILSRRWTAPLKP